MVNRRIIKFFFAHREASCRILLLEINDENFFIDKVRLVD